GQRGVNIVLRLVSLGQIAPPSMPVAPALPNGTGTPAAAGGGAPPLTGGPAAPAAGAASGAPAAPGAPPGASPGVPAVAPVSGAAAARITVTLHNLPLGRA